MAVCRNCGSEINKEIAYKVGKSSYYCNEECYNKKMRQRSYNKKKYKPKEDTPRRELTDYIQKIYLDNGYDKSEINWTLIMSQVKNILESHEVWKYETIQYILYYMYEIEEVNLFDEKSNDSILSLVPFYGMKAEQYFYEESELNDVIDGFDFEQKKIVIKKNTRPNKKIKQIDLTTLS